MLEGEYGVGVVMAELPILPCCSIRQDGPIPSKPRSSASETPAFPPTGVSFIGRPLIEMPMRSEDRPDRDRPALRTDGPSVDQFQLSWRLFYKIRTRSSGPTESFKPYSLTSKKSVNCI
jgi:hypothetical protein